METSRSTVRIGFHRRDKVLDEITAFIYHLCLWVGQYICGLAFEDFDTLSQEVWLQKVIDSRLLKIFALGKFICTSDIPAGAHVFFVSIVADAAVRSGIRLRDFAGSVAGRVVGDDQFEMCKRLVQYRVKCFLN